MLLSGAAAAQGSATYEVEFNATWSQATHPNQFPSFDPHFSPLVGATHKGNESFWQVGGIATLGIERMAELGATSTLSSEINAAISAGTADQRLLYGGIARSPASRVDTFTISADFPHVTLVSMLAPSPDWFIGVDGLPLLQNGTWVDNLVVPLELWDAGTDNGVTYTSGNSNTNPKDPIAGITTASGPFNGQPTVVGTFTFTRVASSLVFGCGINPDGSMDVSGDPPRVGQDTILSVHDPIGTINGPAPTFLLFSALPQVAFPCGLQINFVGLSAVGAPGELLLRPQLISVPLPAWNGSPVPFTLTIPNEPALADLFVYMQGVIFDAVAPRAGLTNGLELKIGG